MNMGKLLLLTLNEQEETAIDKIISAISDYIQIEPMQITTASVLSFPGLEIKQNLEQDSTAVPKFANDTTRRTAAG
jgi:hypothetical protein